MKIPSSASLVALAALSSTGLAAPTPADGHSNPQLEQPAADLSFTPRSPSIEQLAQIAAESPNRNPHNAPALRSGSGSRRSLRKC